MLFVSLTHFPASNISPSLDICVIPFITDQDTKLRMASNIDRRRSTLLVRFQGLFLALFQGFFFSAFLSLLLALLKWLILSICSNSLLFCKNNSWEMCVPWILLNVLPSLCMSWFWFLTGNLSTLQCQTASLQSNNLRCRILQLIRMQTFACAIAIVCMSRLSFQHDSQSIVKHVIYHPDRSVNMDDRRYILFRSIDIVLHRLATMYRRDEAISFSYRSAGELTRVLWKVSKSWPCR